MFWDHSDREKKKIEKAKKKEAYDRVLSLHQNAQFLCYIDDVYTEEYNGVPVLKLEGFVALGKGTIHEKYSLYDCKGRFKTDLEIEEFYIGGDSVEELVAEDRKIAIYPKQQYENCRAGDMLCRL